LIESNCIICDQNKFSQLYEILRKCNACGHVYAQINIPKDELFKFYDRKYFFGDEYSDYVADKKVTQINFKKRFSTLSKFIRPGKQLNLLEIGCAYGFYLDVVKNHFHTVTGIDINEDGVRFAQDKLNLNAIHADLLDYDMSKSKYDVVCMWDTIEHLNNPQLYINKLSQNMDKGSILTFTTMDIASLNARFRKDRWRMIHPPTHIHYFSRKTAAMLLDKYGFDVVYSKYHGYYKSVDHVAYNLFVLRNNCPSVYKILKALGLTRLNIYMELFDIMHIVAVKR